MESEEPEAVFGPKQTILWKRMRYQKNNYFLITQSLNIVQSNSYYKDMNELVAFGEHKARWVTIPLDEYESMKSTIEVLSDPELMEQIKESREDFKAGRFKTLQNLLKESKGKD